MVLAIVSYAFLRVLAEWADLGISDRISRRISPVWQAFVRRLNGPVVLLLWGVAVATMTAAWRGSASADAVALLRIVLFIAPPVLALATTLAWWRATVPPRRRSSY
ncbi:MAG TPA: hypothetical protein VLK84_08810 [Longimicrobium sp.]|nr:hypothetical protein [Longimicrobium sp.]